ncbi:unnamed protein product [Lactuca virosa]|uniref:Uncharacterized protein n=1 Tax=Lactuca virosa TaxID=75947 RepID=A0AAU9MNL5_9ASTR|nr:unnamed protein product [Lactuca virosa]
MSAEVNWLLVNACWIKFNSIKPTIDGEAYEIEDASSFHMVLVQIPMCNEREVTDQFQLLVDFDVSINNQLPLLVDLLAAKEISRDETMRRQSTVVKFHSSNPLLTNGLVTWMICFFRQFGRSVVRAHYLTLGKAFIMNHNLTSKYDFHSYMIRSMEEEFQRIVGVSGPLWGFVVAFMLFNIKGLWANSYAAITPYHSMP